MNEINDSLYSAADLASRWKIHRSSVPRIMKRFGCSGLKLGKTKQSTRRFSDDEVRMVEKLARLGHG